ncbi:hypothetical protein DRW42_03575 [Pedobacter miscanthi]|uniref:Uncharacterized protein n=1 Tax=Pedobacter miscanthi TaxID=2259170 RepID=A0A366LE50_9SPHI|nr:hypothetical protein DRW42_03575 [Pedobacter miscanthi]
MNVIPVKGKKEPGKDRLQLIITTLTKLKPGCFYPAKIFIRALWLQPYGLFSGANLGSFE